MKSKEIFKLLNKYSALRADDLKVPEEDKLESSSIYGMILAALGFYAGADTTYFMDAINIGELPLYISFSAISFLSINNLENICGKPAPKQIFASIVGGGVSGAGLGLTIAGFAFGTITDIVLTGGMSLIGMTGAYFLKKRGKKVHRYCGDKLSCQTWICPKCKKIIKPSKEWGIKDKWNILDICDYLDNGGHEMNSYKALSFIHYAKILNCGEKLSPDSPVIWEPATIKDKVKKHVKGFSKEWDKFIKESSIDVEDKDLKPDDFFIKWENFIAENNKKQNS